MKSMHRLLWTYTLMLFVFIALFASVIYTDNPSSEDLFSMALSLAMFALIPLGIIYIIRRHG